jgi:hypothetical protein
MQNSSTGVIWMRRLGRHLPAFVKIQACCRDLQVVVAFQAHLASLWGSLS